MRSNFYQNKGKPFKKRKSFITLSWKKGKYVDLKFGICCLCLWPCHCVIAISCFDTEIIFLVFRFILDNNFELLEKGSFLQNVWSGSFRRITKFPPLPPPPHQICQWNNKLQCVQQIDFQSSDLIGTPSVSEDYGVTLWMVALEQRLMWLERPIQDCT